jgi:hypothetical protein
LAVRIALSEFFGKKAKREKPVRGGGAPDRLFVTTRRKLKMKKVLRPAATPPFDG